jgi:FkbM family methyltransferase
MKIKTELIKIYQDLGLLTSIIYLLEKILFKIGKISNDFFLDKWKNKHDSSISNVLSVIDWDVVYLADMKLLKKIIYINETKLNLFIRPDSSDFFVYKQVLLDEAYRPALDLYRQLYNKDPETLLDCGANIGFLSLYFKAECPKIKILSVEPFEENESIIHLNKNNFSNWEILLAGIWDRSSLLSISSSFRDGLEWSLVTNEANNGNVFGVSILELINKNFSNLDVLKIDIEGSELQLFKNEKYADSFLKLVKLLVIEIHDEFDCRELIYKALRRNDFIYYNIFDLTIAFHKIY